MSTPILRVVAPLCLVGGMAVTTSAQAPAAILNDLNAHLARSCFNKPTLTLGAAYSVVRKNADGSTSTFRLTDIDDIVNERPDAQANILLRCRDDKPCIESLPGEGKPGRTHAFTVFTITPRTPTGDEVLKLFQALHAAVSGPVKK